MKYRTGPSPDPWEGPSAVSSGSPPIVPCDLGVTQAAWSLLGGIREVLPLWEGRDSGLKDPGAAQRAPPLGLPDLANKNTGHPAKVEFQTDMNSFPVCLWATVHQCQAGGPGDNFRFCWLFPRGGGGGSQERLPGREDQRRKSLLQAGWVTGTTTSRRLPSTTLSRVANWCFPLPVGNMQP